MSRDKKPNILWICTDQQRTDTLGCYGNDMIKTPNIDKLADEGALFENCFVQSPVCSPSRGSFLTGRYPRTNRLRQNGQIIPQDEKVISRLLVDEGYRAGLVGKFHLAPGDPSIAKTTEPRIDDGFEEYNWAQVPADIYGQHSDYTRFLSERGLKYETTPHPMSKWVQQGMPVDATEPVWCAERACSFIDKHSEDENPWFYLVNMFAPHHPFDPPAEALAPWLERLDELPMPEAMDDDLSTKTTYQQIDSIGAYGQMEGFLAGFGKDEMSEQDHRMVKAAYWAMCEHLDTQIGRIMKALEESGQADNTIIVFMSDHGEMLGDHNIYLKGPYFYDPAIRVPMIIKYGDKIKPSRYEKPFEMVNLAPTLLEMAGIEPYVGMQGNSAKSWLCENDTQPDEDIYCEYYNAMPFHQNPDAHLTMLRTASHKLVVDHSNNFGELYDLVKDPLEKVNLWDDAAAKDIKSELLLKMTHKMAFTVDPLPLRLASF